MSFKKNEPVKQKLKVMMIVNLLIMLSHPVSDYMMTHINIDKIKHGNKINDDVEGGRLEGCMDQTSVLHIKLFLHPYFFGACMFVSGARIVLL